MYIQNNKMLPPNSKVIKPYMCSMIATVGPNIEGKLNLSGIEIPYDSQFTTRISLAPGVINQPVVYGFLGNDITFLMLKVTYDETDPRCIIEESQFIEYYLADNISTIRYINKLLVLTGNSQKRIPQMFLSNPTDLRVDIEILAANIATSDISLNDINGDIVSIPKLYHNSIISDEIWNSTESISGSTQFQVMDFNGDIALYLDYNEVDIITINEDDMKIIITTKSDTLIYLEFLSLFEMYQAHSRMEWVMEDNYVRYMSSDSPSIDTVAPNIILNSGIIPTLPDSNIYIYPYNGIPIYPNDIIHYFISEIVDDVDGNINIYDAKSSIRKVGEVPQLTEITEIGYYNTIISITDIANNTSISNYTLIIDNMPPSIIWKIGITDIFEMEIPNDTLVSIDGITKDDIIRKTVNSVVDDVDGIIPNSDISVILYDIGDITEKINIYLPGEYLVKYDVEDSATNNIHYEKTMIVVGDVILNKDDTYEQLNNSQEYIYTGIVDETANIILEGITSIIINNNKMLIWDLGGVREHLFTYVSESILVEYNGISYEVIWNGSDVNMTFTINKA